MPRTFVDNVSTAWSLRTPKAKSGLRTMLETPTKPTCWRKTEYCEGTIGLETQWPAVRKVSADQNTAAL